MKRLKEAVSDAAREIRMAAEVVLGEGGVIGEDEAHGSRRIAEELEAAFEEAVAGREASPERAQLHDLFDQFLDAWLPHQPLVRASAGAGVAMYLRDWIRNDIRRSASYEVMGMSRRGEVAARIGTSFVALANLLVGLTNHADSQAAEAGIDQDVVEPYGDALTTLRNWENSYHEAAFRVQFPSVGKAREQVESEVLASASEAVAADVDKKVLDELMEGAKS